MQRSCSRLPLPYESIVFQDRTDRCESDFHSHTHVMRRGRGMLPAVDLRCEEGRQGKPQFPPGQRGGCLPISQPAMVRFDREAELKRAELLGEHPRRRGALHCQNEAHAEPPNPEFTIAMWKHKQARVDRLRGRRHSQESNQQSRESMPAGFNLKNAASAHGTVALMSGLNGGVNARPRDAEMVGIQRRSCGRSGCAFSQQVNLHALAEHSAEGGKSAAKPTTMIGECSQRWASLHSYHPPQPHPAHSACAAYDSGH